MNRLQYLRLTLGATPSLKTLASALMITGYLATAGAASVFIETDQDQFGTLDPTTGAYHQIGTTSVLLGGLGYGPGGQLYGIDVAGDLYAVNTANANLTLIGATGLGTASKGWSMGSTSDGTLYANWDGSSYVVNPTTAAASLLGSLGYITGDGMNGDASGHLYIGLNNGTVGLASFNRTTGLASLVGSPNSDYHALFGMAYSGGTMYGMRNDDADIFAINLQDGTTTLSATYDRSLIGGVYAAAPLGTVPEAGLPTGFVAIIMSGLVLLGRRHGKA